VLLKKAENNFFKVDEAPSPHKSKRRGRRFYTIVLIEGFLQQSLKGGIFGNIISKIITQYLIIFLNQKGRTDVPVCPQNQKG